MLLWHPAKLHLYVSQQQTFNSKTVFIYYEVAGVDEKKVNQKRTKLKFEMRVQRSTVTAETNTSTGVGTSPQTDVDLN